MKGEVKWTGSGGFVGTTSSGKSFGIYGDSSPSPTEMVIHAHAACSLIDVIDGLKHRIANVEYATVEIEVEMAEEVPKVFTSVNMNYIIKGDVPEALVRRLIESSHERYCRIGIMITRSGATLEWTLDMLD
jgi:putative redox protein